MANFQRHSPGFFITAVFLATTASATQIKVIPTKKVPSDLTVHGTTIKDSYRWLEHADDKDVQDWTVSQNNAAREFLAQSPTIDAIRKKIEAWNHVEYARYHSVTTEGGRFFSLKLQPPKNQSMLVALPSLNQLKKELVIVDPNKLNGKGTTAIDWYEPSHNGALVGVSLSENGSEIGTLHVYTASGKKLSDEIPRVHGPTAGGSMTWNHDNTGFYYTRYPAKGERPDSDLLFYQQVYFHKLGTPASQDQYVVGSDFPKIAEIKLSSSGDGTYILATVANGDGGEYAHYLLGPSQKWVAITKFSDQCKSIWFGKNNDLYILSRADHPRGQILKVSLNNPQLSAATVIVPESNAVIEEVVATASKLYVADLVGGPYQVRIFDQNGAFEGLIPTPKVSSAIGLFHTMGDSIAFNIQSYTEPSAWYIFDPKIKKPTKTAMAVKSPVSFADIDVTQEWSESKDHVKIPITIVSKKGLKKDGQNPVLLTGYGGYGISMNPRFNADLHIWLENGGIFAMANLRGGGEFGEDWHTSGNLTKKQNVFDDFIGCANHLIAQKYTNSSKLAITGRSNGGLLMGAALTQAPSLFAAVVSGVGIYDMIHVEDDPNGTFNITEFGTIKNQDQFKALYAYSPLHHVVDGTKYPAVLLTTGAHDGRVEPYHSKKMTARLQEATTSGKPILLRVTFDGGHGMGRSISQKVEEEADTYSFLFDQLGMNLQK